MAVSNQNYMRINDAPTQQYSGLASMYQADAPKNFMEYPTVPTAQEYALSGQLKNYYNTYKADKYNTPSAALDYGGKGDYGWIRGTDGEVVNVNKDAYNASKNSGLDMGTFEGAGLGMGDYLGIAKGLTDVGQLGLGLANYGLMKDKYKADIAYRNELLAADKTKYNNALARTEAVNAVYGSPNVATKLT